MKFNLSYIYIFVFLFSCTQDMKIMKKPSKIDKPTYSLLKLLLRAEILANIDIESK